MISSQPPSHRAPPTQDLVRQVLCRHLPAMLVDVVLEGALSHAGASGDVWQQPVQSQKALIELCRRAAIFLDRGKSAECVRELETLVSGAGSGVAIEVIVQVEADVVRSRAETSRLVTRAGGSGLTATRAATVVSELARNAVQYAHGGVIRLRIASRQVEIVAEDHGPGIADIDAVMRDDYVSRTGLGKGLKGVKRIAKTFNIISQPGQGTVVTVKLNL